MGLTEKVRKLHKKHMKIRKTNCPHLQNLTRKPKNYKLLQRNPILQGTTK